MEGASAGGRRLLLSPSGSVPVLKEEWGRGSLFMVPIFPPLQHCKVKRLATFVQIVISAMNIQKDNLPWKSNGSPKGRAGITS